MEFKSVVDKVTRWGIADVKVASEDNGSTDVVGVST